ncbi:nicotinate-nucleotide--dimethylbenzimidazole phosphoribosyltransferase [Micromonospora noduli]|uniref:nicotinate-nucleotide--dimethylbenzimidazole phosphoribosyltransferase n=1 Tax=Micromonospora noduli TaxID=709876 RepID=UPI0035A22FFC
MAAARELHGRLTKPAGSLGALEELSVRLAGLAGVCPPPLPEPAAVAIFAGDHGVHAQGVSPWPQEVTAQMIGNFLAGGAVVNAFARQAGASVTVVDVGVATPLPTDPAVLDPAVLDPAVLDPAVLDPAVLDPAVLDPAVPRLVVASVRQGTRDLTVTAALTRDEALAAVQTGIRIADELIDAGAGILLTGDMGIGNTTPAAVLIAAFTGADPLDTTGRGTGVDDPTYAHKVAVVRAALARHTPDPADPLGVLAAVGGLEHAALAGLILGAAARRTPVLLDGVIAVSAALAAAAFAPAAVDAMVAGHRSAEPGATVALRHLGLDPLIDLGLRLGEGTGALLALPVVTGAVRVLHEVATFDSAGVAEK